MADIGKFPGTEMEVFSKYPDSYRLDHPNYGDVAKTPYAKGVITDFKRPDVANPNDPFVVESMVKVTGDWGESDYIPLFYHPKKLYWDNHLAEPPVLAQDFDVATGAFKQAWQSFRCGDEVAVMLKEGVPVAVVGFADGVPRIGEDIVKIAATGAGPFYLQCSDATPYDGKETGPDGNPLNLTHRPEVYDGGKYEFSQIVSNSYAWDAGSSWWDQTCTNVVASTDPVNPPSLYDSLGQGPGWYDGYGDYIPGGPGESHPGYTYHPYSINWGFYTWSAGSSSFLPPPIYVTPFRTIPNYLYYCFQYKEYYVVVGAILYIISLLWEGSGSSQIAASNSLLNPRISVRAMLYQGKIPENPQSTKAAFKYTDWHTIEEIHWDCINCIVDGNDYSQIYANCDFGTHYPGSYYQSALNCLINFRGFFGSVGLSLTAPDGFSIFTVPHTRDELEAAGLWPAGTP